MKTEEEQWNMLNNKLTNRENQPLLKITTNQVISKTEIDKFNLYPI